MADIFISYKSNEREAVRAIADGLRAAGFAVWWDHALIGGDDYSEVIQREIAAAKIVMPIWSKQSVKSQWVRAEADEGAGKLLPVRIDDVRPPLPHNKLHTIDLISWTGDEQDPRWRRLIADVGAILGGGALLQDTAGAAPRAPRMQRTVLLGAAATIALIIAAAVIVRQTPPAPLENAVAPPSDSGAAPKHAVESGGDGSPAFTALRQGASAAQVTLCKPPPQAICDVGQVFVGEAVQIAITSPVAGRLILIDQASSGVQTQIFPNGLTRASADLLVREGETLRLPLPEHGFEFVASAPAGSSRLIALVLPPERALAPVIEENRRTRGIAVIPTAQTTQWALDGAKAAESAGRSGTAFGELEYVVLTR
ncbi:MAG: TIR domain-containing protein [Hyphomonadaceae bacterium]|nr:TIR domain-containing protein [Hyphomonadaceae bacterium]